MYTGANYERGKGVQTRQVKQIGKQVTQRENRKKKGEHKLRRTWAGILTDDSKTHTCNTKTNRNTELQLWNAQIAQTIIWQY